MISNTKLLQFVTAFLLFIGLSDMKATAQVVENPKAVCDLLNRIGGEGTAERIATTIDPSVASAGREAFVLTSQDGKPCIKGSNVSALTTGINWYLNHYAHVNIAWNNLTTDLSQVEFPVPTKQEKHSTTVGYRYYLNYCTFSYSMSTWTWERWQKEIDWMALHGINMPLQIVGLDVVWQKLLTQDLGYTDDEANAFIAGPCFQAWWGMNNLQGWGGKNPAWWYKRQEALAKKILARERELGMEPVLPGYAGMVPSDIAKKGYSANNQGNWCGFLRPFILDPNTEAFAEISAKYYARLAEVMGMSAYYSMDPFHEGANTSGIDVASAYKRIGEVMFKANGKAKWVIQFWQWSQAQYNVLSQVSKGKLIVLDLFSDAHTHFGEYNGHDAVYCILPNFGGRTGLFGRLSKVMKDFYAQKSLNTNVKGVGATPEAIEQVPVLYDALFELPWRTSAPSPQAWLKDYTLARYGTSNTAAQKAWELVRNSALNCETSLQGPHEAVFCARPSLTVDRVSSWGGTGIFYDTQMMVGAAHNMLAAQLSGANYSYDLTDFSRQALTDYGHQLLASINEAAKSQNEAEAYAKRRDAYLQLMLDLDELLSTNENFMLGRWTNMARGIADEAEGTTEADRQWLELNNARTLISTWGDENSSEGSGLRDYSYREWAGMMKDFYYPRWQAFFNNRDNGKVLPNWFANDWKWAHNASLSYSDQPTGNTAEVAARLLGKYFATLQKTDGTPYYIYRYLATDATSTLVFSALRGETFTLPLATPTDGTTLSFGIDLDNDGTIADNEMTETTAMNIPATAACGKAKAMLKFNDGTQLLFTVILKDNITEARSVTVQTADAKQGRVQISGTTKLTVTNAKEVTMRATPANGCEFLNWTDESGRVVSTENPYTYYGAAPQTFTAHFFADKWGMPQENMADYNDMKSFGQFLRSIAVAQNGGEEKNVYAATDCPESLCQTTQMVKAPQGSRFKLHWLSFGGLNYCRLSAYIDLNADGDFEDEGEVLEVYGKKESPANDALNDYVLTVTLPYDLPLGITRIRLRFDSSWASGWDSKTDGMPAKSETKRMVYDIPVLVTDRSSEACTVTVKSADMKQGTADANGQPDTYTYRAGEEIVLRAYPTDGYAVDHWTDTYGRRVPQAWSDGNFLRFYAPESGTYTVVFKPATTDGISAVENSAAKAAYVYDLLGHKFANGSFQHLPSRIYIANKEKRMGK